MANLLFEKYLEATIPSYARKVAEGSDTPLTDAHNEELTNELTEILKTFAEGMDFNNDLEEEVIGFAEHFEMDEQDLETFKDVLVLLSEDGTDESVKSFLKDLSKPYPKPEKRFPNSSGMTALSGETAIKDTLKQHPVNAYPDSFGNKSFSADRYKAFDREKSHMGYNYSAKSDYNNQRPDFPLQNVIQNVNPIRQSSNKAFRGN